MVVHPKLMLVLFTAATQDRQLVLSAMAEWERVTCIRFRPAKPDDRDLVILRDGQRWVALSVLID